jgi:hypothetical protein
MAHDVVRDAVRRVPGLAHVDPDRVAVLAAARHADGRTGNLANCYGLRDRARPTFSIWTRGPSRQVVAVSQWFQSVTPRVRMHGQPMAYIIQLRLPRLLLSNPIDTLFHELYHIGTDCDGRMRPTRHGAFFDAEVLRLARQWLASARGELPRLAQATFRDLARDHGAIVALGMPVGFKIPYVVEIDPPESYVEGLARLYPGYRLAPGWSVRRADLGERAPMTLLTEKNLVVRHYDAHGTRRLPAMYRPYVQDAQAISA